MLMPRTTRWTLLLILPALLGCTSGSADRGIAVDPPMPAVRVGEQMVLSAEPLEDLAHPPEWEVQEPSGGGFLNSRGMRTTYVAPVSAGRYTLVLRSTRPDGSKIKSTQVIRVLPLLQIEPSQVRLAPRGTADFNVRIKGLPKSTVTWSIEESEGGSISSDGTYTAPGHSGLYHVVATSTLDSDAVAIATVHVE